MRIKAGLDAKKAPVPVKIKERFHYTRTDKIWFGLMIVTALLQAATTVSVITERNLLAFLK